MVHAIVNEIFAIMNERKGVKEVWMKFLFVIFVSSVLQLTASPWTTEASTREHGNSGY